MRRLAGAFAGVASLFVAMRAEAAACQGRPTDPAGYQGYSYGTDVVKSYASARIRVHYATSGKNAPDLATTRGDGVPDTVALAADVGEKSLAKYAEMGFKQGPSDVACPSNGGDDKIDIYLVAFAGADGTTVPEACSGSVCASFVLVESTFAGRAYANAAEGFRTVVAHELFHTVQNGYDAQLDRFWAEGTAQWAMKNVYPDLADFERQMPPFFKDNTRSLDTQPSGVTAGFLYGSAVWPLFLTLRHGADTVRDILEKEIDGTKSVAATEAILKAKGSSIAEEYPLFGAWNAATKTLAGTGGYPDAAKYPGVKIATLADGSSGITSGLSYFAYRTTLDAPSKISVETDAARNAGIAVPIAAGKPDLGRVAKLPANMEGDVLVVVAGITSKKTDAPFTLHIGAADPAIAPDAGAPSSSSGGGGGGGGGGCTTIPSGEGAHARDAFAAGAALLAGLVVARRRRR